MARKKFPEDDFESGPRDDSTRAEIDIDGDALDPIDARVFDLEPEQESPFLRAQKRVPVRRSPLPKKAVNRLKYVVAGLAVVAVVVAIAGMVYRYGRTSPRFCLESSDSIELTGNRNVTRDQVMEVFGQDISRNLFMVPLEERKGQLEQIPWVESATVMRLLPNRLSVAIKERTPVAFAQIGSRILLADAGGVLMEPPSGEGQQTYSYPVILGMGEAEPPSKREATLRIYMNVVRDLDSGGANYSRDIGEIDLSDPQDVKITVTDQQGQVLIHLGSSSFLERYKVFVGHVQEWRQQVPRVDSVDLRYGGQVIVNPDGIAGGVTQALSADGTATPAASTAPAAPSQVTPQTEKPEHKAAKPETKKKPTRKAAVKAKSRQKAKAPATVRHKR